MDTEILTGLISNHRGGMRIEMSILLSKKMTHLSFIVYDVGIYRILTFKFKS